MKNITDYVFRFNVDGNVIQHRLCNKGHINETYIIITDSGNNYVLQRINDYVFKNVDALMNNIKTVTEFLNEKIKAENGDVTKSMRLIKAKNGDDYVKMEDGTFWRMYNCIPNSTSFQSVENPHLFFEAGKAFGEFQRRLSDFDATSLTETIPDFHNTPKRYQTFLKSIENDAANRVGEVKEEIEFVKNRAENFGKITSALQNGELPVRVTHNDTKLNNVMFDKKTKNAVCVIDLDTVMPSTLLYDFGDAVRFGCNTATEETEDLNAVHFNVNLFEVFARGFAEGTKRNVTEKEFELLPYSAWLMTMECGMRFLTDYIDGDKYFRISGEKDNYIRCKTQFRLALEMEQQKEEMQRIIDEIKNA